MSEHGQQAGPTCYRHPGREAHVVCQRCDRPICGDCMIPAAVGFQCPQCIADGRKATGAIAVQEPVVSKGIVIACLLTYAATMLSGAIRSPLFEWGSMLPVGVADGEIWRLVTSAFLHNPTVPLGLLHIGFNMYALWLFGPFVESALGRARFFIAYLTMAVGGSVAVYWLSNPLAPTIGASGAVFGLFGFALVVLRKEGRDTSSLLVLLALNVFLSFQGGISWQAHAGGLVTGLILGWVIAAAPRPRRKSAFAGTTALMWAVFLVLLALRTAGTF